MRQFIAYRNRNAATRSRFPLLLDVQSDLLSGLGTRVVIPLTPVTATTRRTAMQTLMPILVVDGKDHLMVTPQLAGIAARELGAPVADISDQRPTILAALDLLITGI